MVWVRASSLWAFYDLVCFAPINIGTQTRLIETKKYISKEWICLNITHGNGQLRSACFSKIYNYLKLVEGQTKVILHNKFSTNVKISKLAHSLTACCNEQTSTYNELNRQQRLSEKILALKQDR